MRTFYVRSLQLTTRRTNMAVIGNLSQIKTGGLKQFLLVEMIELIARHTSQTYVLFH